WTRHSACCPSAEQDREKDPHPCHNQRARADVTLQLHVRPARITDQKYGDDFVIDARQRDGMHGFVISRIGRPMNNLADLLISLLRALDQWLEALRSFDRTRGIEQQVRREAWR